MLIGQCCQSYIAFGFDLPTVDIEKNLEDTSPTAMPVPSQGHCGFHSFPVVD
jgi:hypothetical protein